MDSMQSASTAPRRRARPWQWAGVSLLVTAAVWLSYSWPLPLHVVRGIPHTAISPTPQRVVGMSPGDHLQLLYHFWLAGDMLRGETPWFHNLYEFNLGDDAATRRVGPYYFPFSFLYWAGESLGGRAFGWNFAGFLTLWGAYLLTALLVRRHTTSDGLAWAAALPGIALPFHWISLLGGSPLGFALLWCPALLYGLDRAVRDRCVGGGVLAGLALLFASWTDSHVFFFCTLAAPAWALLLVAQRERFRPWSRTLRDVILPLLPVAALGGVALLINALFMSQSATDLLADGGRRTEEAMLFAPHARGLIRHLADGSSSQVYLGWSVLLVAAVALAGALVRAVQPAATGTDTDAPGPAEAGQPRWGALGRGLATAWQPGRRADTLLVLFLLAALAVVCVLALGPRGPWHGLAFRAIRKLIPPYTMIRQSAKIFCLAPALLALLAGWAWNSLAAQGRRRWVLGLLPAWGLVLLAEYRQPLRPAVCLLDREQPAYAALARDAAARGIAPRALVAPLWPGDSHWTSLYQFHASQYRVRMVNGYQPFVSRAYRTNVFDRLESVNKGHLDDAQLAWLATAGVSHVVLYENAFPEKVSPFPVGDTLRRLLLHPRLRLLEQSGGVWTFRIESTPRPAAELATQSAPPLPLLFPTRFWEAERLPTNGVGVIEDAAASSGRALRLTPGAGRLPAGGVAAVRDPRLLWLVRVRGEGRLVVATLENGTPTGARAAAIATPDWQWLRLPVSQQQPYGLLAASLGVTAGAVDVDLALLAGGPWDFLAPGAAVCLPAASFFHAGYTDPVTQNVVLRPVHDPDDVVFYGWRFPLEPGRYRVTLGCTTPAPAGTLLGTLECDDRLGRTIIAPVHAGEPATGTFENASGLPLRIGLRYAGTAPLAIADVTLSRLE